jgi:DNA-binding winged helix-turn-helix (wHTH) protein
MESAYEFDGFRLEPQTNRLSYRGTELKLTAKACSVLTLLVERAPQVVSRAEFEAAVWPEGYIEPSNLTQTIYMLRKALGPVASVPPIETVNGRGYRLVAPIVRSVVTQARPAILRQRPPRAPLTLDPGAFSVSRRMLVSLASLASLAVLALLLTWAAFGHKPVPLSDSQSGSGGARAGAALHPQAAPRRALSSG